MKADLPGIVIITSLVLLGSGAGQLWQHHSSGWYISAIGAANLIIWWVLSLKGKS